MHHRNYQAHIRWLSGVQVRLWLSDIFQHPTGVGIHVLFRSLILPIIFDPKLRVNPVVCLASVDNS